ncbi:unnamed protein product, partial [Urochloa humidicola]
ITSPRPPLYLPISVGRGLLCRTRRRGDPKAAEHDLQGARQACLRLHPAPAPPPVVVQRERALGLRQGRCGERAYSEEPIDQGQLSPSTVI